MPLIGVVGGVSWRLGWLVLPLAAAVAAGVLVARAASGRARARRGRRSARCSPTARSRRGSRPSSRRTPRGPGRSSTRGRCSWSRTGSRPRRTGCLLAVAACAYVAGNLAARRLVAVDRAALSRSRPPAARRELSPPSGRGAPRPRRRHAALLARGGARPGTDADLERLALSRAPEVRPPSRASGDHVQLGYSSAVERSGRGTRVRRLRRVRRRGDGALLLTAAVVLVQPRRAAPAA